MKIATTLALVAALLMAGAAAAPATQLGSDEGDSAVGSAWNADIEGGEVSGRAFDEREIEVIERVNGYFNGFEHLRGRFLQTDAQGEKQRGKFFVKRPGKFRFDYSRPSLMVILSDGDYISIEDHGLKTVERYSISSTPFRLLLREDVNLMRDAEILDISDGDDKVQVSVRDKSGDASGRITLHFVKQVENEEGEMVDGFELDAWVVTDAQGLKTETLIGNLVRGEPADPELFEPSAVGLAEALGTSGR